MAQPPILLPQPRRVVLNPGRFTLPPSAAAEIGALRLAGGGIESHVNSHLIAKPQGYRIIVRPTGVHILAHDAAGALHAAVTLRQLLRRSSDGRTLPACRIDDWPDFPVRGYMLDISRDKVPTMATLRLIVDLLVELKINQFQLYTEHTFAYCGHRAVWKDASPMTAAQVRALDRCCRARGIELVPNQNFFGHMERWLKHPRYRPLAEAPDGFDTPWGRRHEPTTLCPADPRSIRFIADLYAQLLPNFTSRLLNVGCDETWDLGQGRSRARCRRRGGERVYLEFLKRIHRLARRHGLTMQFWGDIILHRPELIAHLPADVIALEWGYEADHPFDEHAAAFAASGVPFYVCPGTSTWNSIAGRTDNALANLTNAAAAGLKYAAAGYLITDWGDNGHMQPTSASWPALAYGAAVSWCGEANRQRDLAAAIDAHVFRDAAGGMGRLLLDLGKAHQPAGAKIRNATVLGRLLHSDPHAEAPWLAGCSRRGFADVRRQVMRTVRTLARSRMRRADAAIVREELALAAAMLCFAADLGAARLSASGRSLDGIPSSQRQSLVRALNAIIGRYRRVWLRRNRPGGLADSRARLERIAAALRA